MLRSSGDASAVKELGHFEVRKSSSQVRSPTVPDAAKARLTQWRGELGRDREGPASLSFPSPFRSLPFISLFLLFPSPRFP